MFQNGQLDDCLSAVLGSTEHAAIVLGIRCLIRQVRLQEAEATAEAYWSLVRFSGSDAQRGELCSLRGTIAARLGKVIVAIANFGESRGYLIGAASSVLQADLEVSQALFALSEGDLDTAEICAEQVLAFGETGQRATARDILSIIEASKDNFRSQLRLIEQNFAELSSTQNHEYLLAGSIRNLTLLAQQQGRMDLYLPARERAEQINYSSSMRSFECDTFRELGVLASRFGDHLTAFKYLRRSVESAQTSLKKLEAILDGAVISRELNESISAADRISQATDVAASINWEMAPANERVYLYILAEEQARFDVDTARNTLSGADRLTRGRNGDAGPIAAQRLHALARQAHGIVAKAEGDLSTAKRFLNEAYTYWRKIDFEWEAAMVALEMLEIEPNALMERFLEGYVLKTKSSHLARRLAQLASKVSLSS